MFGRIRQAIKHASADRQVKHNLESGIRIIDAVGGSDTFCVACIKAFHQDKNVYRRLLTGMLLDNDFKGGTQTVTGLAGINSMMRARLDLIDSPDDTDASARLELAEETFRISWLLPSDEERKQLASMDSDGRRAWAVERWKKGLDALQNWREFDPKEYTFPVKCDSQSK